MKPTIDAISPDQLQALKRLADEATMSETCWSCNGEGSWHDCGEDSCCCLNPIDDTFCNICHGEGVLPEDEE